MENSDEQNKNKTKKSLTRRLKDIIKRRSQESNSQDRIYDCISPQPQQNNERPTSLFIQLGEQAAQEELDGYEEEEGAIAEERRHRMQVLYEEDNRRSWPLERLQALKLNICEADNLKSPKRSSISEVVDRAKEHRRSLTESLPIPNIPGTIAIKDDFDSSEEEDSD